MEYGDKMKILVIGTVNGLQNEGMRNIITNIAKSWERYHDVKYVDLKDIYKILSQLENSDVVTLCARANVKLYILSKLINLVKPRKKLNILLVQKPMPLFIKLDRICSIKCNFIIISSDDASEIHRRNERKIYKIKLGIDSKKFYPLDYQKRNELKLKYNLDLYRPVILHVGHCTYGRRLEDFCHINKEKYQCIVIASGLFENDAVVNMLRDSGVKLITGFLPDIQEFYQMADVYFFPTISTDFVISVPLSIMEALACGTPVVAYLFLESMKEINVINQNSISFISSIQELEQAIENSVHSKAQVTLLKSSISWDNAADDMITILKGNI